MIEIKKVTIDIYDIYCHKDMNVYVYIEIADKKKMFDELFNFFFSEKTLFDHFKFSNQVLYEPTSKNYVSLYKNLSLFIDEHNVEKHPISILTTDLEKILCDEGILENRDKDSFYIRKDKAGKIGEYILSVLLEKYFECSCIIPKSKLTTDRNMSVFGIDTLHYSKPKKMLMFGESKFTKNIDTGISLIKQSIRDYEKQLQDEYVLILSNEFLQLNIINDVYKNEIGLCMKFEQFLKETKTEKIGVPIFIAHGTEIDHAQIIEKLDKLERLYFFGVETIYTIISLPVVSKEELLESFTIKINEMLGELYGKAT